MAFRDDHEAALARAAALERALADKDNELVRARQDLADRETVSPHTRRDPATAPDQGPRPWHRPVPLIALAITLAVVAVCWVAMRAADTPPTEKLPAAPATRLSCTLVTIPAGATVYRRCRSPAGASLNQSLARHEDDAVKLPRAPLWVEDRLGTTPLTLDADVWNSAATGCEGLFVNLGGGSGIPVSSPAIAGGCDTRPITIPAP